MKLRSSKKIQFLCMTLKRTLSSKAHFFLKFDFDSADFAILTTVFYKLLPQQSQKVR